MKECYNLININAMGNGRDLHQLNKGANILFYCALFFSMLLGFGLGVLATIEIILANK